MASKKIKRFNQRKIYSSNCFFKHDDHKYFSIYAIFHSFINFCLKKTFAGKYQDKSEFYIKQISRKLYHVNKSQMKKRVADL